MQLIIIIAILSLAIGLYCLIDLWNRKCSVMRRILWSPVPFIPFLGPMLYYALFEPPSVQPDTARVPNNPIDRWKEWLANRYNPGYFTGGRIAPVYRAMGPGVGIWFLVTGVTGLCFVFFIMRSEGAEDSLSMIVFEMIFSLIMIYAGVTRIAEAKNKAAKKRHDETNRTARYH